MTHVLIVDDHPQNLYMLRALLQGHGCSVESAPHGAEALVRARLAPPDLVISDLLMPVMDGYTLLRHWKTDSRLKSIPFVVYTATYTNPKDERLALALGADAFIVKPAEPELFMARVHAVLAKVARDEALAVPGSASVDMPGLLIEYNDVLVRKVEKRALQLELSNHELLQKVAELQKTEAALQESEERFRATFEQAAVGIAHVGVDGRFVRVNDKLCDMTGYPRDDLLQMAFTDLTVPEDHAHGDAARRAMLAGEQAVYSTEKRYLRKDGGVFWVSLVASLLRNDAGEPRYFISVITDITDRRLLQEQFRQAQKLESVGQLTGGIAHDFNNLLTVIIGSADLLADRLAGNTELHGLAEMIRTAAGRGADLTQSLLAFARRQPLDPRAVDVNSLLQGTHRMLRRMLPEDIETVWQPSPALWPALVDASQLEAAVLNLCINARDAMPEGGRLAIQTDNVRIGPGDPGPHADLDPGDYVRITVSDSGAGIAPEHLARVFEPFFTTKPAGQGTGLGLSMVYGFVKQSQGHVRIYSEPGQGTSVTLYLPRTSGQAEAAVVEPAPRLQDLRGHESILLVEDNDLVRQYARQQLLDLGYRVVAVADGARALEQVKANRDVDLLFTDVVMPGGMNGRQLVDAARALRPGLKVLFCSGYADDVIVHHGRLDPGVHLLVKPYGRIELASKVRAVLLGPAAGGPGRLLILDDDPMVGKILSVAAEQLGFQALLAARPQEFLSLAARWQPSHVAIDLSMPEMGGLEVLDRLAQAGCAARVIITSGADAGQLDAALARARALGLGAAGALPKPFSAPMLRSLLAP